MDTAAVFQAALTGQAVSPATGDPAVIIGAIAGVCAVAMIVLTVLSRKGKGGRR